MPIYGFECESCGKEFQTLVSSSETATCPSCESTKLTRLLSLIAKPAKAGETAQPAFACGAGPGDAPPCASGMCGFPGTGGCA